jgi:DNA-directed RNA polymerase specialized sigma24 family protein
LIIQKEHSMAHGQSLVEAGQMLTDAHDHVRDRQGGNLDEDALQAACLEVWIWLMSRIAMGHAMASADVRRQIWRRYRLRRIDGYRESTEFTALLIDPHGVTQSAMDRPMREALREAMETKLSKIEQDVLRRVFAEGEAIRGIAKDLGLGKTTVHRVLKGAIEALRAALREAAEE